MDRLAEVRQKRFTECGSEEDPEATGTAAWAPLRRDSGVTGGRSLAQASRYIRRGIRR